MKKKKISVQKSNYQVFKTNDYYKIIHNWIILLNVLIKTYIYLYMYSKFNIKILFISEDIKLTSLIKHTALLTSNYYSGPKIPFGIISNIKMFKKQILILKWLERILLLNLQKPYYSKLYKIFLKLYIKLEGLKNLEDSIKSILFLKFEKHNIFLKEIQKTEIILITIGNICNYGFNINCNTNSTFVYAKILDILICAQIHSKFLI